MKNIKNILILTLIGVTALTSEVKCQKRSQSELRYKIKQEFTGEVRNGTDSVYSVTCILDRKSLSRFSRLYLKMGSKPGLSDLYKMALDSTEVSIGSEKRVSGVEKSGNTITINMGEHTSGARHIEVWTREGRYNKRTKRGGEHKKAERDDRLAIREENQE